MYKGNIFFLFFCRTIRNQHYTIITFVFVSLLVSEYFRLCYLPLLLSKKTYVLYLCKNYHMNSAKILNRNRKFSLYKFFQNLFQSLFQQFRIFKTMCESCLMIYGFFIYHFDFQYFRNSIPFLFIEFVIEFYFGIFNDLLIHIVNYYIFNLQLLSSILFNFSLCSI